MSTIPFKGTLSLLSWKNMWLFTAENVKLKGAEKDWAEGQATLLVATMRSPHPSEALPFVLGADV